MAQAVNQGTRGALAVDARSVEGSQDPVLQGSAIQVARIPLFDSKVTRRLCAGGLT